MEDFIIHGDGPAARFTKILASAGCNITNKREMNFGSVAYNTALMVWRNYESRHRHNVTETCHQPAKIGRNDPCPCGSGLKYKKCCLSDVFNSAEKPETTSTIPFGPEIIPRMWDEEAVHSDMSQLEELFASDPNLKELRFSTGKVESFLKKHCYDSEFLQDQNEDTKSQYIDRLGFQYAEESGEGKILDRALDRLMAAGKNATTPDELRALAAGIVFCSAYKVSSEIDNPLIAFIFRLSVKSVLEPLGTMKKIAKRFEKKLKSYDENDPSRLDTVMEIWSVLTKKEKNAFQKVAGDVEDDLWNCISAGKFPVGLPFATTLPLWYRACELEKVGKSPEKDELFISLVKESGDSITEDDYQLFATALEEWISENKDKQDAVSDSVKMMHMLTKGRSIAPFVPRLMVETCKTNQFFLLDEEEGKLVKSWGDFSILDEDLVEYANFFQSRGYSQIAHRTRNLVAQY